MNIEDYQKLVNMLHEREYVFKRLQNCAQNCLQDKDLTPRHKNALESLVDGIKTLFEGVDDLEKGVQDYNEYCRLVDKFMNDND